MARLTRHASRGLTAGGFAGLAFGLFVAFVGNPLVAYAETFEGGHGGGPVVPEVMTAVASVGGGVLLGLLLGAAFGLAYFFLEPALPGGKDTKSYLLAAAGFVTVSGAPWVLLPPQPPGVEQGLPTDVRLAWYAIMMATGALACGLAGYAYSRLRARRGRAVGLIGAVGGLAVVPLVAAAGPANPVSGPIPVTLASVFRTVTVLGQIGLWLVLASAHAWLLRRGREPGRTGAGAPPPVDEHPAAD